MSLVEARRLMVEVVFNSWQEGTKFVGASCILFLTCLEVIMMWSCFVLVAMGSDIDSLKECDFAIQIVLTSFVRMLTKSLHTSCCNCTARQFTMIKPIHKVQVQNDQTNPSPFF
jgi:hypothetical protein